GAFPLVAARERASAAPESDQVNALPAKDSNQDCCCGHSVGGWSWRCRCGPLASPVMPTRPTCWPAVSPAPCVTELSSTDRWQYVQTWPSKACIVKPMPQRGSGVLQERRTVPFASAYSGAPIGAAMSTAG